MKKIVNFIFLSLITTDLFISFFYFSLKLLNRYFPQMPNNNFLIAEDNASVLPEYDISLYLTILILFIMIFWFFSKLGRNNYIRQLNQKKIVTVIELLMIIPSGIYFIWRLGSYPLSQNQQTNNFLLFSYLLVTTLLIILLSSFGWIVKRKKYTVIVYMIPVTLIIGFFTFTAKFPIFYHDYSYFSGPILQIAHGKTIYNQIGSQYAFVFVLLLGYLAKYSLFDIVYLPALVWIFYIMQYSFCFYLIWKLSDSVVLALISLFSLLTINYFSLMHLAIAMPQVGPIRWLPFVISLYFLYRFQQLQSKKFIFSLAFLSSFVVDSGLYLIMAYGLTLLIIFLKRSNTFNQLIKSIGLLIVYFISIFLGINLINLVLGYEMINIASVFAKIKQYSQLGYGMLPITSQCYIWLVIAVYFLSLIYYFRRSKPNSMDDFLLYAAQLSALVSIYYFGRSHPHNLFNISLFLIINTSILVSLIIKKKSINLLKPAVLIIFYLLFIVAPAYARGGAITKNIKQQLERLSLKDIFLPDMKLALAKYNDEVKMINAFIPEKNIVIIAFEDTYLFYLIKKGNLMNMMPQAMIRTQSESDFGLAPVYKTCPKRIAYCKSFDNCGTSQSIEKKYLAQRLSFIENKCQIKYSPIACTDQLCIGEAK